MKKTSQKFAKRTVKEIQELLIGFFQETNHERLGIQYGKRKWRKIKNNFEEIQNYAMLNNINIELAKDGTDCIFAYFIHNNQ